MIDVDNSVLSGDAFVVPFNFVFCRLHLARIENHYYFSLHFFKSMTVLIVGSGVIGA
jgi:hypothetical protein